MQAGQRVPEDLAAMLPGPGLAAALADLQHDLVPNDEIVEVLEAQSRQLAHEQARMFAVMNEVLHRRPAAPGTLRRSSTPVPYGADEVRAALAWSRRFADRETDLAFVVVVELPLVWQVLLDGRIDRGKAAVFAEHLATLSAEQAEAICRKVLPKAPGWTPWQIGDRIKKLILQLDPQYYARRYAKALRDRRVIAYLDAHGAAVITGSGLPAEDAAAAVERVDQLARAVRRAGHPFTLDQVRADVFLGLLDGSLHGLSRDGIIAVFLERARQAATAAGTVDPRDTTAPDTAAPDTAGPASGAPTPGAPTPAGPTPSDARPDDLVPGDPRPGDPRPSDPRSGDPVFGDLVPGGLQLHGSEAGTAVLVGRTIDDPQCGNATPGDLQPGHPTPDHSGPRKPAVGASEPAVTEPAVTEPAVTEPAVTEPAVIDPAAEDPPAVTPSTAGNGAGGGRPPTVGVEIRVPLATLLGHDEHPGEMPGWGPVTADVARTLVTRQRRAEWRWVVVDHDGRWMSDGITRRRPTDSPHNGACGGVVELQIPETLLTQLQDNPGEAGAWTSVIADIAAQHADRDRRAQDLDAHPDRRFPGAGLRRHVQIRDRFCVFRGCRTPARTADQDHTEDHSRGGPTVAADLGPACRHDHMLKTEGGWDLRQPEPGVFVWTSPLGRRHPVRAEPILPPPAEPVIREPDPEHDGPADPTERPLDLRPDPRAPPPSPPAPRHARPTRLNWDDRAEPSDLDGPPLF